MRISRIFGSLSAMLVLAVVPARAQNATIDSRWISFLGCWQSVDVKATTVCLLPVGQSAVDLVTIENGAVVSAERISAGQRVVTAQGGCTGWQMADWSTVSDRLYLQSEEKCPSAGVRTGNGLIALSRDGSLLYIQGGTIGVKTGVQVQRYREGTMQELPSEVKDARDAIRTDLTARMKSRATALARLTIDDVAEASRHLEADVVEAWLMERGGSVTLDAKRLVALADAGVPSSTIDVLVALAYPHAFAINGRYAESQIGGYYPPVVPTFGTFDACYSDFAYGYGYGSPYCGGIGYGYPGYYPNYPYVIVYTGSGSGGGAGGGTRPHGRVVNGRGYQEGVGADADVSRPAQPRPDGFASSGNSGSTRTSTSSSSGGSTEQRTAKPRP